MGLLLPLWAPRFGTGGHLRIMVEGGIGNVLERFDQALRSHRDVRQVKC